MRVLFASVPQAGHITPLMPLAAAFAQQGDKVVFASGSDAAEPVAAQGLEFRSAGPPFAQWYERLRSRTRGMPGDGLPPAHIERYFLPRLFGEIGTAVMLDDLLEAAQQWRPDLIVFDPLVYAAPLVAAVTEVPAVLHTIGPLTHPAVLDLVTDAVSPIWRELGRDVLPDAGLYAGTTLAICPPSLDPLPAGLADTLHLRPVSLPGTGGPPAELPRETWDRPVVYMTLGTFSNTNLELFKLLLETADGAPYNAVVTIGRDNDPDSLGPRPGNVAVARFIPQADLLPHCAAVVHHAGAGTTFGVLAHGLPSLALPQSADNFTIANRLVEARSARMLMPDEVSKSALRQALASVLDDTAYREAAHHLADEIAAMASPEDIARTLRSRPWG